MKIALVADYIWKKGGTSLFFYHLAKYFSLRHDVHLFANKVDEEIRKNENITIHKISPFVPVELFECIIFFLLCSIKLKKAKYDIIHTAGTAAYGANIISCHLIHSAYEKCVFKTKKSRLKDIYHFIYTKFNSLLEKLIFKRNRNRFIAISHKIEKELETFGVPQDRVSLIYRGVDLQEYRQDNRKKVRERLTRTLGLNKDSFLILFAGDLTRRGKGLDYLLASIKNIHDETVKLLIAGNLRHNIYEKRVKKMGLGERVIFLGFKDDLPDIYSGCDLFVFPSLYDGFGLVVIEAMASGLPVLVSKYAGASEIIEDGKNGVIFKNPKDVESLSEIILGLKKDRKLRERLGKNARKSVMKYDWINMAKKVEEVYFTEFWKEGHYGKSI